MKISLNWLRQHIEWNKPVEELAERLTAAGLEVEGVEEVSSVKGGLSGLVVGEVLTCAPIPETDHLSKTTVNIGNGVALPIVCGAWNVKAGQRVIVAPPGTTVYPTNGEPFEIGKRKLRGEPSEGMICAEDEIGLGTDHAGILVLDPDTVPGSSVADYFKIETDSVLEIGLTANRGDAASHRGVARDVSAFIDTSLKPLNDTYAPFKGSTSWSIELKDEACPRYAGLLMENVQVKESPDWLKNRLRSLGLNPINVVVDITNYVLHDLGQPIHAFDADHIKGEKIVVQKAKAGSVFITLDGVERKMKGEELMICNAGEPMAIAGIFGGRESGVSDKTTRIFIESAYFDPASIRKTAKAHGLNTDASFRYERGTDPEIVITALTRVASLIEQLAGGRAASPVLDVYPKTVSPFSVSLKKTYLRSLSGMDIPAEKVEQILRRLEIKILGSGKEAWELQIPAFKIDVTRPADVVEEIVRIHGLDAIPLPEKVLTSFPHRGRPDLQAARKKAADILVNRGFYELSTNSLTAGKFFSEETLASSIYLKNPLSTDMEIMRPGLLPSLLQVVAYNRNRKNTDLRLFELAKVYRKNSEGAFFEEQKLGMVVCGNWTGESWHSKAMPADLHLLKQEVEVLMERMGMTCRPSKWSFDRFNDTAASPAWVQVGEVAPSVLKKMDIQGQVFYAELNWDVLVKSISGAIRMASKPAPRFPSVRRDLSLVLDDATHMDELNKIIQATDKGLIKEVNVFDVYKGDRLDKGKKSYSISFLLRDDEKTLSDKEIDALMSRLILNFEKQAKAIIRK